MHLDFKMVCHIFLKSYKDAYQSVDIHYTPNPALPIVFLILVRTPTRQVLLLPFANNQAEAHGRG